MKEQKKVFIFNCNKQKWKGCDCFDKCKRGNELIIIIDKSEDHDKR